jgi:hypothetical protein
MVDQNYFRTHDPVTDALLGRVLAGFPVSIFTKPRIEKYLNGGAP